MWAAGKGSDDVIRTMLNLKVDIDINMADKYGGTALHAAALSGHVSTVQLLLKHNAQVDATDVMKHTPLFRACEMGHKEVIQTLIKGGARVDLVDQDGHSPLHWAALGGNPDVCQILIENKINPNIQDYAGRTPLQCAAYGGYINCMVVLLENNADPNIQDKEGRTALHWLCNNGYLDAIKLLLGFGAFPNHMESNEERKREEENRRKASELQKEMQNSKTDKLQKEQQDLSETEKCRVKHPIPQSPLPQSSISESQAGKSRRSSNPGFPNKVAVKNKSGSLELLGEDHKIQIELSKANSKSKFPCLPFHSRKENNGSKQQAEIKHQTVSATLGSRNKKHKEPNARTTGSFTHARKRHNSSMKAASSREKSENQSQSINNYPNYCEGTAACIQNGNCTNGGTRNLSQCDTENKGNPWQLKARSKGINDERWSPAGSSRPGSARGRGMNNRSDTSSPAVRHTSKLANNKACLLPVNNARTIRLLPDRMAVGADSKDSSKLDRNVLMSPRNSEDQLCFVQHKSRDTEPVPFETRKQMIEKERARKELFWIKNCAANIIQRAWRSYQLRRQFLQLFSFKRQCKEDEDKWRQEAAAFCIKFIWNKQLNPYPLKTVTSSKNIKSVNKSNSGVNSTQKPSTLRQIYGCSQEGRVHCPVRPPSSKHKVRELQMLPESELQYLCLLENTGKFRQFSYNLKSMTTVKTKFTRPKDESKTGLWKRESY
nr:inversin-like isoform X1 [Pogona vitticeps]